MGYYKKKPVVVEAVQYDGTKESGNEILGWIGTHGGTATRSRGALTIETLEGSMVADPGWWVIRGVKGEFYPCDPEVFAMSYEPVEQTHDHAILPNNGTPAWSSLPCLWCERPLSQARVAIVDSTEERAWDVDSIRCICGVVYLKSLLEQAHPEEWDRALRRDGYRMSRNGDELIVTRLL